MSAHEWLWTFHYFADGGHHSEDWPRHTRCSGDPCYIERSWNLS